MLYVIQVTVYMVEFVTMTAKRHHQHHSDGKQQASQIVVPAVVVFVVRFYVEHIFSLVLSQPKNQGICDKHCIIGD